MNEGDITLDTPQDDDLTKAIASLRRNYDTDSYVYTLLEAYENQAATIKEMMTRLSETGKTFVDLTNANARLQKQLTARSDAKPLGWADFFTDGSGVFYANETSAKHATRGTDMVRTMVPIYEHPPAVGASEELAGDASKWKDAYYGMLDLYKKADAQLAAHADAKPVGWVNVYPECGSVGFMYNDEAHARSSADVHSAISTIPVYEHPPVISAETPAPATPPASDEEAAISRVRYCVVGKFASTSLDAGYLLTAYNRVTRENGEMRITIATLKERLKEAERTIEQCDTRITNLEKKCADAEYELESARNAHIEEIDDLRAQLFDRSGLKPFGFVNMYKDGSFNGYSSENIAKYYKFLNHTHVAIPVYTHPPVVDTESQVNPYTAFINALKADREMQWAWHCNIAMAAFDKGVPHRQANKVAELFLERLLGEYEPLHDLYATEEPHG